VEDVDVWCYAMLELHARNDDEAGFCVDCKLTVLTDILTTYSSSQILKEGKC